MERRHPDGMNAERSKSAWLKFKLKEIKGVEIADAILPSR
jgi:hypothetical protein